MKISLNITSAQFISAVLVSLLLLNSAHAGKLYKWVDANGRVSYQDKPPPKNAKILDEKTIDQKKSAYNNVDRAKSPLRATPIDIYVTNSCVSCDEIVDKLAELNIPHNEKDIENFRDIQSIIIRQTNGLTVPAVFIDNRLVQNAKLNTLEAILRDHGYLHPKAPKEIIPPAEAITPEPEE